jgi:hypothetical protein
MLFDRMLCPDQGRRRETINGDRIHSHDQERKLQAKSMTKPKKSSQPIPSWSWSLHRRGYSQQAGGDDRSQNRLAFAGSARLSHGTVQHRRLFISIFGLRQFVWKRIVFSDQFYINHSYHNSEKKRSAYLRGKRLFDHCLRWYR